MKIARLWLIVLLCVLLPLRSALAVATACPGMTGAGHLAMQMQAPSANDEAPAAATPADMGAMGDMDDMAMADTPAPPDASPPAHDGGHPDKCSTCQGCCASSALPGSPPAVPPPPARPAAAFPAIGVPAASFLADGQERPPRRL